MTKGQVQSIPEVSGHRWHESIVVSENGKAPEYREVKHERFVNINIPLHTGRASKKCQSL